MRVRTAADEAHHLVMVELAGPLTPHSPDSTRRVVDAALARGLTRVIVDLSGLDDIDAGLALALLEENDELRRAGGWLWLVHGAGTVGSTLRHLGVHGRVPSSPSRAAAGWC